MKGLKLSRKTRSLLAGFMGAVLFIGSMNLGAAAEEGNDIKRDVPNFVYASETDLGSAGGFAVFANDYSNMNHMEGTIAAKNFTLCNHAFGVTDRVYYDAVHGSYYYYFESINAGQNGQFKQFEKQDMSKGNPYPVVFPNNVEIKKDDNAQTYHIMIDDTVMASDVVNHIVEISDKIYHVRDLKESQKIDFDKAFASLKSYSNHMKSALTDVTKIVDQNDRKVIVCQEGNNVVNVSYSDLRSYKWNVEAAEEVNPDNYSLVINVTDIPEATCDLNGDGNPEFRIDGEREGGGGVFPKAEKVLFNFGDYNGQIILGGSMNAGVIIAPDAYVEVKATHNGNVISNKVVNDGCEIHQCGFDQKPTGVPTANNSEETKESESQNKADQNTENNTNQATDSESQNKADQDTENSTNQTTESESQNKADQNTETNTNQDTKSESQNKADQNVENNTNQDTKSESQNKADQNTETNTNQDTKSESQNKSDQKTDNDKKQNTDSENQSKVGQDTDNQRDTNNDSENQNEATTTTTQEPGTTVSDPNVATPTPGTTVSDPNAATPTPGTTVSDPNAATPTPGTTVSDPNAATPTPGTTVSDPNAATPTPTPGSTSTPSASPATNNNNSSNQGTSRATVTDPNTNTTTVVPVSYTYERSSENSKEVTITITSIPDEYVPTSNTITVNIDEPTTIPGTPVIITIEEEDVPLAGAPRTGENNIPFMIFGSAFTMVVVAGITYFFSKKSEEE